MDPKQYGPQIFPGVRDVALGPTRPTDESRTHERSRAAREEGRTRPEVEPSANSGAGS